MAGYESGVVYHPQCWVQAPLPAQDSES